MVESRVLPETIPFPLVDTKPFGHSVFGDGSTHCAQTDTSFAGVSKLHTTPEFASQSYICPHDSTFSGVFQDETVKQDPGLDNSPIFGQDSLIQNTQTHASYEYNTLNASVGQTMQQTDLSPSSGYPGAIMSQGNLLEPDLLGSWTSSSVQVQQSNFDILLPNQRGGKRGPFRDPNLREQTAQTRKIGSCIRCRMQRIRVSAYSVMVYLLT